MGAVKMKDTGATADVGWEKSDNSEHFYVKFINWGTIYQPPQEFIYATGREADAELQKIAEQEYQSYLDNGKYDFKWLYAGKFAEGISEEASTKEGKLSPTTKSVKGSFYERSLDNAYEISVDESNLVTEDTKAAEAIKNWFSKVQEKNGGLG